MFINNNSSMINIVFRIFVIEEASILQFLNNVGKLKEQRILDSTMIFTSTVSRHLWCLSPPYNLFV